MFRLISVDKEGEELEIIRQLFREYQLELGVDLCFQSFAEELHNPLKKYGSPQGALLLAYWNNEAAGCIALTPLQEAGVCEMKRLYVRPSYRKNKIGLQLTEALIATARQKRYIRMKLDTLQRLQPAIQLYQTLGFREIEAYNHNPEEDVVYMEREL